MYATTLLMSIKVPSTLTLGLLVDELGIARLAALECFLVAEVPVVEVACA